MAAMPGPELRAAMIIHYCDKCGVRIGAGDVESGTAPLNEENKAICAKCSSARRGTARMPVGATSRDSRLGIQPARRDSKIRIEPAQPTAAAPHPKEPALPVAPAPPAVKPALLLIGAGVAALVAIAILIFALGGPPAAPDGEKDGDRPPFRIADVPALPPAPNVPLPAAVPETPANAQVPKSSDAAREPDGYDPRAAFAQSLLEQAKAFNRNQPDDPWTYREKLRELAEKHRDTPAAKEAQAILATLNPGPRPADPALPPDEAWAAAIDLLALADPAKHALGGGWTREGGALQSGKDGRKRLALPYLLPTEYDLRVVLARVEGRNNLCINLTHLGKPLTFHLAGWGNRVAGWEMLDNKRVSDIGSSIHRDNLIENDRRYVLVIQMRKDRWVSFLDGKLLAQRPKDVNRSLSQTKDLTLPNPLQLGFISVDSAYRLEEIKVLEVTGAGKVLSDAEVAEVGIHEPAPEPQTPVEDKPPAIATPAAKASAYAVWLKTYLGHWERHDWAAARNCVGEALRNPELTARAAELALDQECLAFAEMAQRAIPKGAELLKDGRAFTLEELKGKKHQIGRKTKILKADESSLKIEEEVGGGKLVMDLPLALLTPETLFELARLGLPDDGKGALAIACYRFPVLLKATPEAQRTFEALELQAEKAQAPHEPLGRLRAWRKLLDRERQAQKALLDIERTVADRKGPEAKAAFDEYVKNYADTAFVEESRETLAALQTRIFPLLLRPGLIAKYFSGDEKDKRKPFHFTRVAKELNYEWGDKGPADGVPGDFFLVEFTGLLRIDETGEHSFTWGGDSVELWLDGKACGKNKSNQKIDLQPGFCPIKAVFVENTGTARMEVRWKPPSRKSGEKGEKIPAERLWHLPEQEGAP